MTQPHYRLVRWDTYSFATSVWQRRSVRTRESTSPKAAPHTVNYLLFNSVTSFQHWYHRLIFACDLLYFVYGIISSSFKAFLFSKMTIVPEINVLLCDFVHFFDESKEQQHHTPKWPLGETIKTLSVRQNPDFLSFYLIGIVTTVL